MNPVSICQPMGGSSYGLITGLDLQMTDVMILNIAGGLHEGGLTDIFNDICVF